MPRAFWKGYLRLSLVTCPIELFPATSQSEKTHFHQINTQTGHRLRQQMVDEETGRAVDLEHKGRGYELTKGKYVEIDEDELKAIQIESTHTVDIDGFVPRSQIDKRYLDKPITSRRTERPERKRSSSSATPCRTRNASRSRALSWRTANISSCWSPSGRGCSGRRYVTIMRCAKKKSTLPTSHRRASARTWWSSPRISFRAKQPSLIPRNSKDEYEKALRKLVQRKAKGRAIEAPPAPERPSNVINLMDALRESVKRDSGDRGGPPRRGARKHKTRRRKAA